MAQLPDKGNDQHFEEAYQEWDIDRLVNDIEVKALEKLTPALKRNLKAIILVLSPKEAANQIGITEKSLTPAFSAIYRLIETLTGAKANTVSYKNAHLLLALANYRKQQALLTQPTKSFDLGDRNSIPTKNENIDTEIATSKPEYLDNMKDSFVENNVNPTNSGDSDSSIQEKINRKLDLYANVAREKLYGVDVYLAKLKEYLNNENDWLIGVVGQGGVGKTSVVEKLVRENCAELGFTDFAWVTAKRTFLRMEDLSKGKISNSSINLISVITSIAIQLEINLPTDPNVDNLFKYLWIQLKKGSYLIVIDNLETLEEGKQLIQRFNPYDALPSSKIILTSREKLQQNNNRIREVILQGIDLQSTLALIRYKGDHVERIVTATDEDLLPIREISGGIPLIILLVVNLIATNHQLNLEQIINKVKKEKNVFSYLYGKSLDSISAEALHILDITVEFCSNSSIDHSRWKALSKLNDNDFNNSISELIRASLLQNVSRLTDQPKYSIHSLLYEFLENDIANQ